jgi:excisionase family DNA binding protein
MVVGAVTEDRPHSEWTMPDNTAPDPEFLTVKELADLLRLKERKVYDLAASGAVPCSRATGKLLFPAAQIREWIARAQSGAVTLVQVARPPILLGSHDPLLDWAVRQSRCGLATHYDGSLDGLARFARVEGVAAGLHIHDAQAQSWNVTAAQTAAADQNAVLVSFAKRKRGLVFRTEGPAPKNLADLAGWRIVPRQPESGTDTLFREMAAQTGLDLAGLTLTDIARTEDDAVEAVKRGEADVAFGLQAVAQSYGLEFLPLIEEEFALLVDRKAWFDPPLSALMAFCQTPLFEKRAQSYNGYDIGDIGKIIWNS